MNTTVASDPKMLLHERGLVVNFAKEHPEEFSQVLGSCPSDEAQTILRELPTPILIEVLAFTPRSIAANFMESSTVEDIVKWFNIGSRDTVTRLARRIPQQFRSDVIAQTKDVVKLRILHQQADYGKNSVAQIADKDFVWFISTRRCENVRQELRAMDLESSENALVVNEMDKVVGLLDERKLLRAGKDELVGSCVRNTQLLPANASVNAVVELEDWHTVDRLPVVDRNQQAIGILHWSRLADKNVVAEEAHEESPQYLILEVMGTMLNVARELPGVAPPKK